MAVTTDRHVTREKQSSELFLCVDDCKRSCVEVKRALRSCTRTGHRGRSVATYASCEPLTGRHFKTNAVKWTIANTIGQHHQLYSGPKYALFNMEY